MISHHCWLTYVCTTSKTRTTWHAHWVSYPFEIVVTQYCLLTTMIKWYPTVLHVGVHSVCYAWTLVLSTLTLRARNAYYYAYSNRTTSAIEVLVRIHGQKCLFRMIFFRVFDWPILNIFNMATVTKYIPSKIYVGTKNGGYRWAFSRRLDLWIARHVCLFETRCLGDLLQSGASVIFFLKWENKQTFYEGGPFYCDVTIISRFYTQNVDVTIQKPLS